MSSTDSVAVSLHSVSKKLRRYNCRDRWLRRDLLQLVFGKNRRDERLTVLDGIDLDIRTGEAVGIVGVNGSGKSTLLKVVAGIFSPTSGSVIRRGSVCCLLDLGAGFHDELTGRENIQINGAILGIPEKYLGLAIPEIEEFADLQGFLDTPIRYYSSGMKARLGFSIAMNADPDIFLIDEVLAVGDEGFREKCFRHLEGLVSRGATVIIVSHDAAALKRLCGRTIWLDGGRIRADGPSAQVCEEYSSHFGVFGGKDAEGSQDVDYEQSVA